MTPETPTRSNLSSTIIGALFLLVSPALLALVAAATFWALGVAGSAFWWMVSRF